MSLVWQSVFPESRMISKILPENGFPRQCAHWLGMTLYLRFVYNLRPADHPSASLLYVVFSFYLSTATTSRRLFGLSVMPVDRVRM